MTDHHIAAREARGLRGRYGTDVWNSYLNASPEHQNVFLTKNGVPAERAGQVRSELAAILSDLGVVTNAAGLYTEEEA